MESGGNGMGVWIEAVMGFYYVCIYSDYRLYNRLDDTGIGVRTQVIPAI